jgi:hypothetical protein
MKVGDTVYDCLRTRDGVGEVTKVSNLGVCVDWTPIGTFSYYPSEDVTKYLRPAPEAVVGQVVTDNWIKRWAEMTKQQDAPVVEPR